MNAFPRQFNLSNQFAKLKGGFFCFLIEHCASQEFLYIGKRVGGAQSKTVDVRPTVSLPRGI